jgi:cellulose synthase/poly-beta-1,6-N-acetylglucosamine synthase-like glycosyltransferase
MRASIIVPFQKDNSYLRECIDHCLVLEYPDFEVILLPDDAFEFPDTRVRVIPTGPIGPAEKRDMAIGIATGEVLAFIDDDAYPRSDWLKNAMPLFSDQVAAVCGPGVTPPSDGILQKASGAVFASLLGGGNMTYRYIPGPAREVDDYPSCNFLIKKDVMQSLGGFDTRYWPGEDTKLCLDLTKNLKKKILYSPDVFVYHHRRNLFVPHLRQIGRYAVHRGFFVRKFPETSFRLSYFIPTMFVLGLLLGWLTFFINGILFMVYLGAVGLYLSGTILTAAAAAIRDKDVHLFLPVFGGIIATHVLYGILFIKGLVIRRLEQ